MTQFPPFSVVSLWCEISPSPSGLQKTFLNPLSHTTIRFFMNFMFRFSIDFQPKAAPTLSVCLKSHPRREAVLAAQPLGLTNFNNKNGCNTTPVTVTLYIQATMFQPLNPLKTVPHLLHFWDTFVRFSPLTNLNVLNFMSVLNSLHVAKQAWPSGLRTVRPEQVRVIIKTWSLLII